MSSNKFSVFLDKPRTDPIKIHKIDCTWREKYTGSTVNTEWYDVPDLDSAELKANQLSIEYDLEWRYAKCGGKCFSRTFKRK